MSSSLIVIFSAFWLMHPSAFLRRFIVSPYKWEAWHFFLQNSLSLFLSLSHFSKGPKLASRNRNRETKDWRRTAIFTFFKPTLWFHIQGLTFLLTWREVFNRGPLWATTPPPLVAPKAASALSWLWPRLADCDSVIDRLTMGSRVYIIS